MVIRCQVTLHGYCRNCYSPGRVDAQGYTGPMVPLQHVAPGAVIRLIAAQPHSAAKIEAAWRLSVGGGLAKLSRAEAGADGVLTVAVTDAHVARALESHRPTIERRLQAMLGDHGRTFQAVDPSAPPRSERQAHAPASSSRRPPIPRRAAGSHAS